MELKLKMEEVRKNPRQYLDLHMADFEKGIENLPIENLLSLYFACASFQHSDEFHAID